MDLYSQIIISLISSGVVGGIAVLMIRTYLTEKIKGKIKGDYDRSLEKLKSQLLANQSIVNNALTSLNQAFHTGQKDRIEAVKLFWEQYLIIKDTLYPIDSYFEYLTETEICSLYTPEWKGNNTIETELNNLSFDERWEKLSNSRKKVEGIRPFLNGDLWLLISFLISFKGRMMYLYSKGIAKKKIPNWKLDDALINMAEQVLTEKEMLLVKNASMRSITYLQSFVEVKIISQLSNIITGQTAADVTYDQAIRLNNLNLAEKAS